MTLFFLKIKLPIEWLLKETIFRQFCGGESIEECKPVYDKLGEAGIGSILDYSIEGKEREEDFETTCNEILKIISLASENRAIPYTSVKLTGIMKSSLLEKSSMGKPFSTEDAMEFTKARERLDRICSFAADKKVPVYIDAEESWLQNSIDRLCEQMMQKHNKSMAIVSNTLQMYRHDRIAYLQELIKKARNEKFFLGLKLVRGAYWEKENKYADDKGLVSPVHQKKEDTDADFDKAVSICLDNIDLISLCAGTHNEQSTYHLVSEMEKRNIPPNHSNIYFSQLFGMSDHISFNMASAGFNVTKYLPYGPVRSVVPYLMRRAEENTSISGQMGRELQLLVAEIKRRQIK